MTTVEFVNDYKAKKINERALESVLEVKKYLPFNTKRGIVKSIIEENMQYVDGMKKIDPIAQYISFTMSMIISHTSLEISDDPINDYDLLAESGLLNKILALFSDDVDACNIILKMMIEDELADNNPLAVLAKLLTGVADALTKNENLNLFTDFLN